MGFAKEHCIDLCELRDWVMEYGQPPDPLTWIPVRILVPFVENRRINEGFPDCCPPGITSIWAVQRDWIPVVIQERT